MLLALVTSLSTSVLAVPAHADWNDDYPYPTASTCPSNCTADPWGFYKRECTSFVAWRLNHNNGMPFTNNGYGNASNWGNRAQQLGYTVNMTPAVGSVAWWSSGHVAWVESVSGSNVTIEEYNFNFTHNFNERVIAASSVSGYIHFKDLPPAGVFQPYAGDFNGDGYADIGMRNSSNGTWFIRHGPSFADQVTYQWAYGTNYQPFVADFNGDGLADIGMRDTNNGVFYIKHGPSFNDQITYQWANGTNYRPFAADFNHDGYADIGMRDTNNGVFYIKHGTNFGDQITYNWASGTNYQPYAADFNGDGYADIGMRDVNNGVFYIKHGTNFGDQITYQWVAG